MGCLLFKESKLNFLENLKTEEYINSRRELTFEKDVHKYLNDLVNRLNLNYDLNLKALATIKEVKIKTGKDFSRDSEKFILTPIEESFEQIDNRRKELGIYEDRISIGEYNKTQGEKISNQEEKENLVTDSNQAVNQVVKPGEQGKLFQEAGKVLETLSKKEINNLQSTISYQLLNEKNEELPSKGGQSYIFLKAKDAERFSYLLEKHKEFPKTFRITSKVVKYEKDENNFLKKHPYNVYKDYEYVKSNNNKKSNLYNIVDLETGEIVAEKVRVLHVSKDTKSEIAEKYGLEFRPTKVFNANRSIAFALYRQKPSKAKYIAQAKKYLYDAIKFLNPEESKLTINLDEIEKLLDFYPEEMWDYINTTYSPEDSTNINASIALQNAIKLNLPKLGFLQEIERISGIKLQKVSFKNYDRSGKLAKIFKHSKLDGEWGDIITIDHSNMTVRELKASIKYYLSTKNIFKKTSEEENVKKYAEHKRIDYNKLRELVFGDIDNALENIAYNNTGNSDTIELSKWRESIRNYDWQMAELFSKPYENFLETAKERITTKFKDKNLSNGVSHLDYFFSGNFNWLNINFNNISGTYYEADMETEAYVGVEKHTKGIIEQFEVNVYNKPKAGKNFLREEEVFNRLAAILHEPFHALHALSYGTKEELELRKAFDNLYKTTFGREMMNQVFGSGYNKKQEVSYDTLYKEFTAFATQLMLYPKEWIQKTDLRSNDIYDFIEKIQTLQDKTYEEIINRKKEIGTVKKLIEIRTEEKVYVGDEKIGTTVKTELLSEEIKLNFLEKLYNYLISALKKVIPLSEKFFTLISDSKIVEKKVIEDVFSPKYANKINITYKEEEEIIYGEEEEIVKKTVKLPEEIKKSKEEFLASMDELKSAINTLMQIDSTLFSSKNITNFFTSNKFNQERDSKQNIENFKEFVQEEKDDLKPFIDESNKVGDESINERLKKYEESIKIPNSVRSKVLEKIEKETEKVKEKLLSLGLKQEGNKFELITNSYATFRMKLKELENVNVIISTNKTSDFYQIIARLKNVDSTMELKKQGELPFTPIEVKQVIQEQQFLNDVADNVFEELSEEEKQILKKKIENGDYNLNCKI